MIKVEALPSAHAKPPGIRCSLNSRCKVKEGMLKYFLEAQREP